MQERLWEQEPRDRAMATLPSSNRFNWLWITIAVLSALLLTGWPLPEGVSGSSTSNARVFQLFPAAFQTNYAPSEVDTTVPDAPSVASRVTATVPESIDPLAQLQTITARVAAAYVTNGPATPAEAPDTASAAPGAPPQAIA